MKMTGSYRLIAVVLLTALLLAPLFLTALAQPTPLDPIINPSTGTVTVPGSTTPSGNPQTWRTRPAQTGGSTHSRISERGSSGARPNFYFKSGNVNAYGGVGGDGDNVGGVILGGNGTPSWIYTTRDIDWGSFFGVRNVVMSLDPLFLYSPPLSGSAPSAAGSGPAAPPRPPPPPPPPGSPRIVVYVQLEGAPDWLVHDLVNGRAYWVVRTRRGEYSLSGGQLPYSAYANGVRLLSTTGSYLRLDVESLYLVDGGRVLAGYNVTSWRLLYGGPDPYNVLNPREVYRADGPRITRTLTTPGSYKLVATLAAAPATQPLLVNYKTASWLPPSLNLSDARAAGEWVYALPGDPVALYSCTPPGWMASDPGDMHEALARAGGHYRDLLQRLGEPAGAAAPLQRPPGNLTINCGNKQLAVVYAPARLTVEWRWRGDELWANATALWPDSTPIYGHLLSWVATWGLQLNVPRNASLTQPATPPPGPGRYTLTPAAYPGLDALKLATVTARETPLTYRITYNEATGLYLVEASSPSQPPT